MSRVVCSHSLVYLLRGEVKLAVCHHQKIFQLRIPLDTRDVASFARLAREAPEMLEARRFHGGLHHIAVGQVRLVVVVLKRENRKKVRVGGLHDVE